MATPEHRNPFLIAGILSAAPSRGRKGEEVWVSTNGGPWHPARRRLESVSDLFAVITATVPAPPPASSPAPASTPVPPPPARRPPRGPVPRPRRLRRP